MATKTRISTTFATEGDDAPKWRIEHSVSDKAGCYQAACKRVGVKIAKGELRIGTHVWFEGEEKYVWQWRHWGCATKHQIEGLRTISGEDPNLVPGYAHVSAESQEQVRSALEEGTVIDKAFKDIREDLARSGGASRDGEIRNAVGYKVEIATQGRAGCRDPACKGNGVKIAKGELRLGIAQMWDDSHTNWVYKHWTCTSRHDLHAAREQLDQDSLEGIDNLPEDVKTVVLDSLRTGQAIEPPKPEPQPATKDRKPRVSRRKDATTEEDNETRKRKTHKRAADGEDTEDIVPKKRRGRQLETTDGTGVQASPAPPKVQVVVDPEVARIEALTKQMRSDASK